MMAYVQLNSLPPPPPVIDSRSRFQDAPAYMADEALEVAIETAMFLDQPLLLTGEPGCGKTSVAYFAAWRLGMKSAQLIHAQIRSDTTAPRLKYEFDSIHYFRESQLAAIRQETFQVSSERFIKRGPLWRFFDLTCQGSAVLLLDEIDKAPRDLPNDLLHELDQWEFEVPEWLTDSGHPTTISGKSNPSPFRLIVLTSNGERELPGAFLRRCVHHHIGFNENWLKNLVRYRQERLALPPVTPALLQMALARFLELRSKRLQHSPGGGEFLVWLKMLAQNYQLNEAILRTASLEKLPYLGTLLKHPRDIEAIKGSR